MSADGGLTISRRPFDSSAVGELLSNWNDELRARIPEFSPAGGSTVDGADFDLPTGVFLVAFRGGSKLGCGGLRRITDDAGEIKRLFVTAEARGRGVGRALLLALEAHATSIGYSTIRLDTHGGEHPAVALFRSAGYRQIGDYNGNPYASYWFEKSLG